MSSVNLLICDIDNQEEMKEFLLSEAEYLMRDVDFDTDYALTVKLSSHLQKKRVVSYECEISLRMAGERTHWKVSRNGKESYSCVRNASRSFKNIVRKQRSIELGSAVRSPLLC